MQRDKELLKCIVTFMGMYHRSLARRVSHHRRVPANVMRGGNGVMGPRHLNTRRHTLEQRRRGRAGPEEE